MNVVNCSMLREIPYGWSQHLRSKNVKMNRFVADFLSRKHLVIFLVVLANVDQLFAFELVELNAASAPKLP